MSLIEICPITLKEANAFVEQHHRHHNPVVGHKFSIGCTDGEKIVGVAIVGRPVSRHLDDGWTLEVTRLCTDGTRNACSMLYAAARAAEGGLIVKSIVDRIGKPALLEQTAEECAELAHACLKEARRLRGENPTPKTEIECWMAIIEEMADVEICLKMLREAGFWSNLDLVDKNRRRMAQRLDEAGK